MLAKVKTALRLSTSDFDSELTDLINAAKIDLGIAGVTEVDTDDPAIILAIKTFCKMNFGQPDDYDRMKAAYDEQKKQLSMAREYAGYDFEK